MSNFEESKKNVAKEISKFRMQKGMTVEDFAGKVGISTTALSNILKGNANLKTSTLIAICVALEVFPGEILPKPSFYNKWEMRVEKVNHKFAHVPDSSKEKVLGLVLTVLDAFIKTKVGGGYVVQMREEEREGATQSNVVKENKKYMGYFCRTIQPKVEPYHGRYGHGYKVHSATRRSTYYHPVTYYVWTEPEYEAYRDFIERGMKGVA